jgi:hypothetical protein
MPSLIYGTASNDRGYGALPPLTLINMFVEQAPTSENNACLQSRPGLTSLVTNGSGPIKAIFCNPGTLNGSDFSVSGTTLYKGTVSVGNMSSLGSGPVSIAGSNSEILIAGGGTMYRYTGTGTPTAVTFPDSASVTAVCFLGSLFVAVRGDTTYPGRFYFSAVLDGSTWDALNYATAEREADALLDIAALNDHIIFYGQSTIEIWADTGQADLPFTRIESMGSQSKGIIGTGCVCEADNTKFHIGSDGVVYRLADAFTRISDHWLEEKIIGSTARKVFTYRWHGHEFICVRLDTQTFAYDCATQAWCELQSNGGQFYAQCAAMKGTTVYLGHGSTGQIMGLSGYTDLGDTLTREFTAAAPLDSSTVVDNLWFWINSGASTVLSGQGSDPVMEIQLSRDAGATWTDFDSASIGNASIGGSGQYRVIPEFRRLGQFDAPGFMVRGRVTDPVPFRLSSAKINEPLGGRSRS